MNPVLTYANFNDEDGLRVNSLCMALEIDLTVHIFVLAYPFNNPIFACYFGR